jgi:hypothetical protein
MSVVLLFLLGLVLVLEMESFFLLSFSFLRMGFEFTANGPELGITPNPSFVHNRIKIPYYGTLFCGHLMAGLDGIATQDWNPGAVTHGQPLPSPLDYIILLKEHLMTPGAGTKKSIRKRVKKDS